MAKPIRVLMFFQQGDAGWSELLWRNDDDTLYQAQAAVKVLEPFRIAMLSKAALYLGSRVSEENVFRDSVVNTPMGGIGSGPASNEECPPFLGALVRQTANSLYRRSILLRGVPKGITSTAYNSTAKGKFLKALENYAGILTDETKGWKLRVTDKFPDILPIQIIKVAPGADVNHVVLTQSAPILFLGERFFIEGRTSWPSGSNRLRGNFIVKAVDGADVTIEFPLGNPPTVYPGGLLIRRNVQKFVPIAKVQFERISTRRTGLVFGHSRSRQSPARP